MSLPLIDELAATEKPVPNDGKKLQSVPHSMVALERFFTQAGPGWFPLLRGKGYLGDPPPIEIADDQTIAYTRWPAGRYLARMATEPSAQGDVMEVAFALKTDKSPGARVCRRGRAGAADRCCRALGAQGRELPGVAVSVGAAAEG